jgi:hypothetical protein
MIRLFLSLPVVTPYCRFAAFPLKGNFHINWQKDYIIDTKNEMGILEKHFLTTKNTKEAQSTQS